MMKKSNRILVVDDRETDVTLIRDQLLEYDFEVEAMYDSRGVIEHLRENKDYALLIFDVNLPHKDGITLASQVRDNISIGMPILFVSADANKETRARIRRLSLTGPVDFLEKGKFNTEGLFNASMSLIRESSVHSKLDEVHGRVSDIGDEAKEIKASVDQLSEEFKKNRPPTPEQLSDIIFKTQKKVCDERSGAACKDFDDKVSALTTLVETKAKTIAAPLISAAIEPETIVSKAMTRWMVRIIVGLISTIITAVFAWFVYTWNIATEAQTGVKALNATTEQILNVTKAQNDSITKLQQILRDSNRNVHGPGTTINRFFTPVPVPTTLVSTSTNL
jgi:CheY-like chemotaxis protein